MAGRQRRSSGALSLPTMLNMLGVVAGATVALASALAWGSPIGFFAGVAGAFLCVDPLRQSW